ncbi:amino acid adenylation domain-containing protein [Sphaerisporangium viridialbum]|uniref:non-ribosomal peptide synthetase/MFS transporter n=1 Tax=Sphaerisporangium viridialbum TaxID=46189 RepID=UPI003C769E1C
MSALSPSKQALLAQRLRRRATVDEPAAPSIPVRAPGTENVPLSFGQERIWFLDQLDPGDTAFAMSLAQRWRGPLDVPALRRAFDEIVARHETLRTRFPDVDGSPVQVVDPPSPLPVECLEVTEDEAARVVAGLVSTPFDLSTGPLLRVTLLRLGDDDHVLSLVCHHIVADGLSVNLLLGELAALYDAFLSGERSPLTPLPVQYADYAIWQRERLAGEAAERSLAYWRRQLDDAPALELPADRPRPAVHTSDGDNVTLRVDAATAAGLERLASDERYTLFMTLLAAYQTLLMRHAGQRDICVGSPIGGRGRLELEPLIGYFLDTLVLRGDLSGDPSFRELLDRTRSTVLDAFTHQEIPFERLMTDLRVERDLSRSALFQTMIVVHTQNDLGQAAPMRGIAVEGFDSGYSAAKFDVTLEAWRDGDGLTLGFGYRTDLFDRATIGALADRFVRLLRAVVADPGVRLSAIDLLGAEERERITGWSLGPARPSPAPTVPELIAAATTASPHAMALAASDDHTPVGASGVRVTYAELDERSGRLALALRRAGAGPESIVGVCLDRSPELFVTLLAVWKAGAAYLPLDPAYPDDRLAYMLADSSARLLVADPGAEKRFPGIRYLTPDGEPGLLGVPHLTPDGEPGPGSAWPWAEPGPAGVQGPDPARAAYVIYTSGSTGRPKGVVVTHAALAARVAWMRETYELSPADRVLQFASVSFDTHAEEVYPCLSAGATLTLLPSGGEFLPDFLATPEGSALTVLDLPTPYWHELVADIDAVAWPPGLRLTILGADQAEPSAVAAWHRRFGGRVRLVNTYGPTEATIIATGAELRDSGERPPIGRPLSETSAYVLDEWRNLVPAGVPGELYIGGAGLARGYLNRPELTAERFVTAPDGLPVAAGAGDDPPYGLPVAAEASPGDRRLYRTGDRARWRPDGQLEFLGRLDGQVKLRGYRIELGEVEARLLEHPGIARAAVVVDREALVAYVVGDAEPREVRDRLASVLPAYMVPKAVVTLDRLPLTPNGKLDRRALPSPEVTRDEAAALPGTPAEVAIAAIWSEVLGLEGVGAEEDFFALGGHSLSATKAIARMRRTLGDGVSLMDLFQHPTVRGLAALVERPSERPSGGSADGSARPLLHELTPPLPPDAATVTYVCVPYGGGSAVVYRPLAQALPAGHRLLSIAIPGNDLGIAEEALPFDELARRCAEEILRRVSGPLVLYGQSSVGSALTVEIARRLESSGRELDAVYIGAAFPFARPRGRVARALSRLARAAAMSSDRAYANWLASMGVDLSDLEPEHAERIVRNMRREAERAEEYFTDLLDPRGGAGPYTGGTGTGGTATGGGVGAARLRAPLITLAGDRDPATEFHEERYREWHFLADTSALVVIHEAGHFFLKYRAAELAQIITQVHPSLDSVTSSPGSVHPPVSPVASAGGGRPEGATWWLAGVSRRGPGAGGASSGPEPSMRRFTAVAAGQLVSILGSAFTEFAVPIWIYQTTGSVANFALFAVLGLVPGLLVAPFAGAIVDRLDRRRVMLAGDIGAGGSQLVLGTLLWTGNLQIWHIYLPLVTLSVALSFQRLAYASAIPQLVPKRFLGHANGIAQMVNSSAQLVVPLVAVGLMAVIGLGGIIALDVVSYGVAIGTLLLVRFPVTMAARRRETLLAEIAGGFRYSWGNRGFRAMLLFFAGLNVFLSPLFLMVTPLVLSFGTLNDTGRVAFFSGMAGFLGGLVMSLWGGPRRMRMRGVLYCTLALGVCAAVTGLRADLVLIAAGAFGMTLWLTLLNGIYATIVQVKVPQRFHGRVFALNTVISWSTLPLGFGVVAPVVSGLFEPMLARGGVLAPTVGALIGTGPGRGIGFMYVVFALGIAGTALVALRTRSLAGFDEEIPDATPDDLVGAEAIGRTTT